MKKIIKRILLGLLLIIVGLAIWQHELVEYGIRQGWGQFKILSEARPIEEFLKDPSFPDSLKQKIYLIQEIRKFAIDSLGINDSKNYTTMYDQKGKSILWIVTACEPYQLKAKKWSFPFVGEVSYKGFFNKEKLDEAEKELKAEGYDTDIDEVAGWSTLGWFRDPVLTSMLRRSEGQLANLIIHELTHGTLFVKNNLDFNENLAEFVGDYGALRFLAYKYGKNSSQYFEYANRKNDYEKYSNHLLRGTKSLDSLYKSFGSRQTKAEKDTLKYRKIKEIIQTIDTISFASKRWKRYAQMNPLPNNAFFIGYMTYRSQQNVFEEEFRTKFNADFPAYLAYLKKKYPY
jgi:predicted aminopeptidase